MNRGRVPSCIQTVAYGDISINNPAIITSECERQADTVIELQLRKAGARLAYWLDASLTPQAAGVL